MSPGGGDGDDRGDGRGEDDDAFAEAMRGARPLARGRERVTGAPAATSVSRRRRASAPALSSFIVEQTGDTISGRARDVATRQVRELRAGAHAIDARIDLHGRGRDAAVGDLERFVAGAAGRGARCLLVIHGRGRGSDGAGPVLRPAVWEWLAGPAAERCGVLAFSSARPSDGGDGATLMLLRRPRAG